MSNNIADFLNQTKTDVEAVVYNAALAFNRVWIVPAVDIALLMQIPRWPVALLNDAGGELSPSNGKIWTRRLEITVLDAVPRDHVGEQSVLAVLGRGEALIAALEWNDTDSIYLAADSDVQALQTPTGLLLVSKTYTFEYQIQRA